LQFSMSLLHEIRPEIDGSARHSRHHHNQANDELADRQEPLSHHGLSWADEPSFLKCHRLQPRANTPNDGQMLPVANATMPQAQANKTMERAVRMSHTISENVSPLAFRASPQISSTAKEPRAGTAHFTQPAGVI